MAPDAPQNADVVSAGAVVTRKGPQGREVLLVHRPKYDDWSFPKGKQEPGEHITATACREVLEETGVEVRLGQPLRPQLYSLGAGRAKTVHYWVGQVVGDDDVSDYEPNNEIDTLGWFSLRKACERLTYLDDVHLIDQLEKARKRSFALLVVRHAKAVKRSDWTDADDALRPLNDRGFEQARRLVPVLHAYGVTRLVTSPSTRCVQTVTPYAEEQVISRQELPELSEEGHDPDVLARLVTSLLDSREAAALCTHRPVLPQILTQVQVQEEPLAPSELIVCHHRKGRVLSTERHLVQVPDGTG